MPQLPWDFTVIGTPISAQAKSTSRGRWKAAVRAAASAAWPAHEAPLTCELQIHVTHYYDSVPVLDNDNMIKPIQDALQGIVYIDDRQIVDTHGHRRDLNERYEVRGMTPEQAKGFVADQPFVHIRIEALSSSGRLP